MDLARKAFLMAGAAAGLLWSTSAVLASQSDADDIVWPTYSQVSHTTDAALTCPQLRSESDRVSSDIRLLDKARDRVEVAMRSAYDLDRYTATKSLGGTEFNGNGGGEEIYPKARDEIVTSERIAKQRHDFLTNLLTVCKNTAPPSAAP